MGYYINPQHTSKEQWLNDYGLEVTDPTWDLLATSFPGTEHSPEGRGVYVCLVDNGPFTAAGICYNEQEFDAFNAVDTTHEEIAAAKAEAEAAGVFAVSLDSGDQRPRKWYVVPRKDIIDVCPDVAERLVS